MKTLFLFFTPFVAGLLAYIAPRSTKNNFRLLLVFAGAYLFALTTVHTMSELREPHSNIIWVGVLIALGFLIQYLLGIVTPTLDHRPIRTWNHYSLSTVPLLLALCIHAFLEGMMLAQSPTKFFGMSNNMLLGVVLHRAPIAFAMIVVLAKQIRSKKHTLAYLTIFSLAAPLGLWTAEYFAEIGIIHYTEIIFLYAFMSGGFLYIVTAIIFEKKQSTYIQAKKILTAVLGISVAMAIEYWLSL